MRAAEALNLMSEPTPPEEDTSIPVSLPQIAYTYTYGFTLPAGTLEATQQAHMKACDRLGPLHCQIVTMTRNGDDQSEYGQLRLRVDAAKARNFGAGLKKTASGNGGALTESGISAEDLSKQIIDTDARVSGKTLLAQRLTQLLATRSGTTADLVGAERALADVQEELDSARSRLADMKGRVAMSDIAISYSTRQTAAGGFIDPLKTALSTAGETFGGSIAALFKFLIAALPWALALFGGIKLYRKLGGRFPRLRWPWRKAQAPAQPST